MSKLTLLHTTLAWKITSEEVQHVVPNYVIARDKMFFDICYVTTKVMIGHLIAAYT